ncbi:hypothetical protein [Alloactinosynnema sp. L-07]|uniref:hypothetical protein n=1 Tax=Alloactinosynnema sp. L-07 TaxID=1653480 RepID=UPI00065F0731|nr:hypothetical protein [Alloactinosynnema sp. L-07]CRK60184.1 hypothetical protein [Alloactinosynnema sp. L-07]
MDTVAVPGQPMTGDAQTAPLLLVRLRSGPGVRETQRMVHLVAAPVPQAIGTPPAVLPALCGFTVAPGVAEVLPGLGGMPCERCMSHSASPEGARLRAATLPAVGSAW